jgi:hypothetical protein
MPNYSFLCTNKKCKHSKSPLEIFFTISNYQSQQECPNCHKQTLFRDYQADLPSGAVKKGDNEITVGHLAHRNTDRMSEDQKEALWVKNHEYMEKPLSYQDHKRAMEIKEFRQKMQKKLGQNTERKKRNVKNQSKRTK